MKTRKTLQHSIDELLRTLRNARKYGVDPYNSAVKLSRTRQTRLARHEGEANLQLAGKVRS